MNGIIKMSDSEDETYVMITDEYIKDDIINDIRSKLIEYCDINGLPLCDFLTNELIDEFIKFLQ